MVATASGHVVVSMPCQFSNDDTMQSDNEEMRRPQISPDSSFNLQLATMEEYQSISQTKSDLLDEESEDNATQHGGLSRKEIWNLSLSFLAWACVVCNLTVVVGTSSVVFVAIGGKTAMSSLPFGAYIMGTSFVSLLLTPWMFQRWGRKVGFMVGNAFGLAGTAMGAVSVIIQSPVLLILALAAYGCSTGIGFYWRFAAIEVVPPHWSSRAITLVVSGGCIAAFAGPESSRATQDLFPQYDLQYMGVFFMTGVFCVSNMLFTVLVQFPKNLTTAETKMESAATWAGLFTLLKRRSFIVPVLVSASVWSVMPLPMSVVRVAMADTGFNSVQSMRVIEWHFFSMYSPGFVSGRLIQKYGFRWVCYWGCILMYGSLASNLLARSNEEGTTASWYIGLMLVGAGWNFCFTAATVWVTQLYRGAPEYKTAVQAANDFMTFFVSGCWIISASYIYDAGGGGLNGWVTLNIVAECVLGFMIGILLIDVAFEALSQNSRTTS